jgi:phage shock protein A
MSDFFRKLNVLVKASLNEILDSATQRPAQASVGHNRTLESDLQLLRRRVDDALAYEGELSQRVQALLAEVERLDAEADRAVDAGQEDAARQAVSQLQRAQQRLAVAESDLHEHRLVTQELIARVNELDAAVQQTHEVETSAAAEHSGRLLNDILDEMRQKIAALGDVIAANRSENLPEAEQTSEPEAIDDDLARRRERLSKK